MDLSFIKPSSGSKKKKKRVGRGKGSGNGKTSGRGHKGQGARAGRGKRPGFEGGQMPLQRRVPKRGFNNPFKKVFALVSVGQLEIFDPGSEISPEILHSRRMVRNKAVRVKLLGDGILSKALTVKAHGFSAKAREKIEASGGRVETL